MSPTTRSQVIELQPDVKLHIVREGTEDASQSQPTLVFLHYWGGSTRTWSRVIPLLSPTYPTVAIDFRGWGDSVGPADPDAYSVLQLADDVETVISKHLDLQDVVLVGLSMGAKVAQVLAGRQHACAASGLKGRLRGVVLVSPAPPTPLVMPPEASAQQIHAYETWQNAEFVARNVLVSSPGVLEDQQVKQVVADMLKGIQAARTAWPAYAMSENIVDVASRIQVPVMVLAAAQDVVEPLERIKSEVCGNIPGSDLVVIPNSGHLSPLEAPDKVSSHIIRFLEGL